MWLDEKYPPAQNSPLDAVKRAVDTGDAAVIQEEDVKFRSFVTENWEENASRAKPLSEAEAGSGEASVHSCPAC